LIQDKFLAERQSTTIWSHGCQMGESMVETKHAKAGLLTSTKQDDGYDSLAHEDPAMLRCSFKHQP
jgi:hypothetical protein